MLTDEEKRAIRAKVKDASGEWHFDLMMYANEIERAVMAKAGEQEQKLDKPARVNATNFMAGVPARMVVEAAQRYYEYRKENPPEKDSELQQKFFSAIDNIKKPLISSEQLLEIAISAISSVQSFDGLAVSHAQRWLDNIGTHLLSKLYTHPLPAQAIPTEQQILSVAKMVMPAAYLAEENYRICSFAYALLSAQNKDK